MLAVVLGPATYPDSNEGDIVLTVATYKHTSIDPRSSRHLWLVSSILLKRAVEQASARAINDALLTRVGRKELISG